MPPRRGRRRAWIGGAALAAGTAGVLTGCGTVGYVAQAVGGHMELVRKARPIPEVIADNATPAALRERLELAQRIRRFAVAELALPDTASYTRYADLGRAAVVWNVVATPELSLALKTWCFPLVGCVGYRGFFDREAAEAFAAALQREGHEVDVYGVPAYSTLGWTEWLGGDPLLNTFVGGPATELARLVFHELAHHVAYAADDTLFNESYAVAVERLGLERWLAQPGHAAWRVAHESAEVRRGQFRALARSARAELAAIYAGPGDEATKRAAKAAAFARLRAEHQRLKAGPWQGFAGYDAWFARANNATLAVQGAYDDLVPAFFALFEREGRDFARFHAAVRALAALPKAERRATLGAPPA